MKVVSLITTNEEDRKSMCFKLNSNDCGRNIENLEIYIENLKKKNNMCQINLSPAQIQKVQAYVHSTQDNLPTNERLSNEEIGSVGFTFQLNSILRAGNSTPNIERFLMDLDSAFNELQTTKTLTVFRVCNYLEMLPNINNRTYSNLGYTSTSLDTEVTQQFYEASRVGYFPAFLTINIPVDSNVLLLNKINNFDNTTYEDEVLFKRDANFNININQEIETTGLEDTIGRINIEAFQIIRILEVNFIGYAQ
jgi:hypothetical protein